MCVVPRPPLKHTFSGMTSTAPPHDPEKKEKPPEGKRSGRVGLFTWTVPEDKFKYDFKPNPGSGGNAQESPNTIAQRLLFCFPKRNRESDFMQTQNIYLLILLWIIILTPLKKRGFFSLTQPFFHSESGVGLCGSLCKIGIRILHAIKKTSRCVKKTS